MHYGGILPCRFFNIVFCVCHCVAGMRAPSLIFKKATELRETTDRALP